MGKKSIISILLGSFLLLFLFIGASFAYFMVEANNFYNTKSLNANIGNIGTVSLVSTDNNLYLNLTRTQMSKENQNIYYAVKEENGIATTNDEIIELGYTNVKGGNNYSCDYTLTITSSGTLKDALNNTGVLILIVNGKEYDIYETNFPLEINGKLEEISEDVSKNITAQLKFVNTNVSQNELINKNIIIKFDVTEFKCVALPNENLTNVLLNTMSNDELWHSTLEDDGYRYVGENPNNYICFGTTDKNTCLNNQDKYMYRIIGIFEDDDGWNHAKLIKKEALNIVSQWNSKNIDIDWNESDLYKGINGNYFLTNTDYSYMQEEIWENKIMEWNYTMTNILLESGGPDYYEIDTKKLYLHELNRSSNTLSVGEWKNYKSYIGLMYVSDYQLSLGSSVVNYAAATTYKKLRTGWMHISLNDTAAPIEHEWTMTRIGMFSNSYSVLVIDDVGYVGGSNVNYNLSVRPVFYLKANVEYNSGVGSINDPYILKG